jgi:DNA-binding PadR family transcriptional regulator
MYRADVSLRYIAARTPDDPRAATSSRARSPPSGAPPPAPERRTEMLELAVLGLLKERAMHGYELRKQLTSRLGFFWTVSFGSLYPTLRKMEKRGAVEKVRPVDPSQRRKQVYRITESGEREFLELLEEGTSSAWEEEKFPLRLTFFRYLRPETRIRLLERRKDYLLDKLEEGRRSLARAQRDRGDTYTVSLMRHGCEVTERDIAWLDELIAAETGEVGETPPDPAAPAPDAVRVDDPDRDADEDPASLQTR